MVMYVDGKKKAPAKAAHLPLPYQKEVGKCLISFFSGLETEMGIEKNGEKNSICLCGRWRLKRVAK